MQALPPTHCRVGAIWEARTPRRRRAQLRQCDEQRTAVLMLSLSSLSCRRLSRVAPYSQENLTPSPLIIYTTRRTCVRDAAGTLQSRRTYIIHYNTGTEFRKA